MNGLDEGKCYEEAGRKINSSHRKASNVELGCPVQPAQELQGDAVLKRLMALTERLAIVTGVLCDRTACVSTPEQDIDVMVADPLPAFLNEINKCAIGMGANVDRLNHLVDRLEI